MAALDDDDTDPATGLSLYSGVSSGVDPYDAADAAIAAREAAASAAGEDYGGGEDTVPASALGGFDRVLQKQFPAGSNRAMLQEMIRQRLAQRAERQPGFGTFNPAEVQFDPNTEMQLAIEPPEKPKEEAGWGQIFARGLLRANEAAAQGKDIAEGKKPRESKTPRADYEDPLKLEDFASPMTAAKKLWLGLAQSYPAVAASVAGGFAGSAAGSAIPVVGTTIGGVVGGAAGMGIGSALMEIGPAYAAELQATPDDVDGAWDRAMVTVGKAGVVGAASMALFGAGKPLSNALKSILTPVVQGAEKPVAGIPLRAGVQLVGQPAISAGGQVTENVIEGKPITTNLNEAVAGGIANVVPDVAAAAGGRALRAVTGRRPGEATPGVADDQNAALRAAQGEPQGPDLYQGPELPPRPYPERPPLQGPDLYQGPELPPRPYPPRGPEGFTIDRPPEEPPPPPPPGGGVPPPVPPRQPFVPEARPVETEPTRPADFGVGRPPEEPPPPPPVTTPEEFGIGRPPGGEEPPPPPPPSGGGPPPPRPQPFPPTERPVEQRPTRPEDFAIEQPATHVEPDDVNLGQSVAKNAGGEVIGKGASPEEALADARARKGAPYAEEAPAGAAAPEAVAQPRTGEAPLTGTTGDVFGGRTEKAPPAGAAKAEPAAKVGGDAVPKPPVEQTLAEQVKAKGEARTKAKATGKTWGDLGREDAAKDVYNPPSGSDRARTAYQFAWEEAAEKGAWAARRGETVTKPAEELRTETGPGHKLELRRTEPASGDVPEMRVYKIRDPEGNTAGNLTVEINGERALVSHIEIGGDGEIGPGAMRQLARQFLADNPSIKDLSGHRVTGVGADEVTVTRGQVTGKPEGTRTKSGAYVSPGEAAEPQAPRPAVKTQSDLQSEVASDAAAARKKGLVSEATRRMAEAPTPADPFHVPENMETGRRARRIIGHILKGMPIADAVAAFGKKEPGSVGRPRNVESLSSHIREQLDEANTRTADQAREKTMGEAAVRLRKLGPEKVPGEVGPERRAILDELDERLKLSERVRTDRARLEKALGDIETLERGGKITGAESKIIPPEYISPSRLESASKLGAVNEPTLRQIEQAGGAGASLHKLLDDLIANPVASSLAPQLTELARLFRRVIPETKVRQGEGRTNERVVGTYDPVGREIYLNTKAARTAGSGAVTLLHETVHRGTADYITHLYEAPEANLTPRELAHKTALGAIRSEVSRVLDEGSLQRSFAEAREIEYALRTYDEVGVLVGPHELAAQILTQIEVYNALSRERASPEFRAALDRVGMGVAAKATIWDGFKKIIRNIFGVPEKLDSVFDHVLRPLTEIVEEGSRFRRTADAAAARETIRHNNDVLGPESRRTEASKKSIADAIVNFAGTNGRRLLRGSFHTATQDAYIDAIKPYIPSATAHRQAYERVQETITRERVRDYTTYDEQGRAIVEPHADKTDRLVNQLKFGRDGEAAQELMTDITFAKADLLDPAADNSHVPSAILTDLQQRFGDLDPTTRQAVRESFQVYAERNRVERQARIRQFTESGFPDMTRAQHDDIVQHMSTIGGIEDIVTNTDRSALAQRLGPRWANSGDLITHLAESERGGFVKGNYAPLNRHGEYVVSAGKVNTPEYVVQMFERPSQAKEFKAKLEQDRNDVSQVFVKSDTNFRQQMIPDQLLGTFDQAMAKAGVTGERAQAMREAYAGQLIMKGMRQASNTMKREYIAGASNEQARNLMMDFAAHTARMGHLEHQGEINRTYFQAEKEARALHQPGPGQGTAAQVAVAQAGVAEMRRRMTSPDGDNSADQMGRGVRGMTTWTVLDALARPAHLFMTLAGNHAFALSMLGGRHGAVAGTVALTKAYAQLGGTAAMAAGRNAMAVYNRELKAKNWMTSEVYRDRLKKAGDIKPEHVDLLIDDFNRSNIINQTHMSEVRRMAGPDGWLGANGRFNYIARGLDIFGAGEHAIDSMSRVAVGKAAFVMELAKNKGDVAGALAYAKDIARKSQPDWNFYNRPRLTTRQGALGQFGSLVTQFKSFGMHAYGVQGNLIANAYRSAKGSAERREALKSLALLHGSHALLWGGVGSTVFGGVPMMAAMGMYDYLTGSDRPHTNREWENWSRNYVHNTFGKPIADVYQYGLPAAVGINTSSSLRFSNIMATPEIRTYDKAGYMEFGFNVLTGASGQTASKMAETGTKILRGDTSWETYAALLPRILEDPVKAGMWATGGMKDAKGARVIIPAEQFTGWDIASKAAGFNPSRVSTAQAARGDIQLSEDVRSDAQEPLLRKLLQTVADKRDTKEVIAEITRFNNAVRDTDKITGQQIQQRLKQQAQINALPGQFGMQVPKRQMGKVQELVGYTR